MSTDKMKRNYSFKPGRGCKMLEQLESKENRSQEPMVNSSADFIIEGTPPPLTPLRNITPEAVMLDNKNNSEIEQQNVKVQSNSSADIIIEGTPPPLTPPRNMTSEAVMLDNKNSSEIEQQNVKAQSNVLATDDENLSPSLIPLRPSDEKALTSEQILAPIDNCTQPVRLEDDLCLSDDSVADPDWMNPQDIITNAIRDVDSDTTEENNEEGTILPKKIKTARWHKKRTETYQRHKQKYYRSKCLPYKNYKNQLQPAKAPKSGNCGCKLNCLLNIPEDERIEICKFYWGLIYSRQKDFILNNVSVTKPQRCLINATRKRTVTRSYFFQTAERKIKVCEKFFKSTLCISNGPINKAFDNVGSSGSYDGDDKRGRHEAHNKTKQEDVEFVKMHINTFPTMESHYCRKTSSKSYLESTLSISKMHELYEETCRTASRPPVSINVYRNIFCTQYNLDFHKPKKDQCLLCHKYNCAKAQNSSDLAMWQQKYEEHISLKEQSREAKELDKIRANEDKNFNSVTLDLQKVLHMPTSNVSLLYYLRKLNVYNLTIYEASSPNDGFCYLWTEIDGKKGSDEIGTALYLWIQRLPSTVKEISIFSDTCGGQNRNQFLLCLQMYLVQTTQLEVIEHKYLESGHTHMEVDSMHSAIENQMRLMPVFSIIDLCNVIRLARSNRNIKKNCAIKRPYEPIVMDYTDILDLKDLRNNLMQNRSVGSDGQKLNWLKVKCFRMEKKRPHVVQYRYDYKSDYQEINLSKKRTADTGPQTKNLRKRKANAETLNEFDYNLYILKKAYNKRLSITKAKKKDLMKMCSEKIIPPELHHWYQNLPDHEGPDFLPDEESSDADDE